MLLITALSTIAVALLVAVLMLAWRCGRLNDALRQARFASAPASEHAPAPARHSCPQCEQFAQQVRAQADAHEQERKKFASMVSHEFRAPLATIDGVIQMLEMRADVADEATRKRYRKIGAAVDRLMAMLDEYLSPDRLASIGRTRQDNDIAPLLLLEEAAAQARTPDRPITVQAQGLPAKMRCDPAGMRLCLQILLDNALKYAPAGKAIQLLGQPATGGGIELLVLDDGPGIAADELLRIFDKGFRGSNVGMQAGSGLGLYMARSLIEHHGGALTAENRAGGGAAFRIWLPVAPAAASE
jgi:signal transduction histidine kinase